MERFGILIGRDNPESLHAARKAEAAFHAMGEAVRVGEKHPADEEETFFAGLDAILAIGGDGTILAAARRAAIYGAAVLGVNLGRIGFLTEIEPEQIDIGVKKMVCGEYEIDQRLMLKAECGDVTAFALNDILLTPLSRGRVIRAAIHINSVPADYVTADGVLVSGPTGSTAYALSCGGPIMPPGLDAMLVAAVCPHSLSHRHLIVEGGGRISLLPAPDSVEPAIYADGKAIAPAYGEVIITRAEHSARLIRFSKRNFYSLVRAKFALREPEGEFT